MFQSPLHQILFGRDSEFVLEVAVKTDPADLHLLCDFLDLKRRGKVMVQNEPNPVGDPDGSEIRMICGDGLKHPPSERCRGGERKPILFAPEFDISDDSVHLPGWNPDHGVPGS